MNEENIKSIIALQRINNQVLSFIDSEKGNNEIKLKQVLDQLYAPYESIEPNYRDAHSFFNQYQLISSLYTFVVLPKESFFDSIPNDIRTNSLKVKWGLNNLKPSYDLRDFLRHIRNSVSHGRIDFTDNLYFTFTDINPRNKNVIFNIQLSSQDLMNFTQALAYWCLTKDIDLTEL
jgi:hypothetical protein